MIRYSFIIPHKNAQDLLQKCLETIPRRPDVQIIVVDDNSDPVQVNFDKFPGIGEPNVEVHFTKESKGAGYARNVGLLHATGNWIVFADADDFFIDGLQEAMDECLNSDCDVIFFKNKSVKLPSGLPSSRGLELNRRVDVAIKSGDMTLPMLYSCPWQKFFKREFLISNNIHFNEVRWGNDVVFMGRVAKYANKISVIDKVIYCITETDNSIIKDHSLESRIVRFHQESENVGILKTTKYKDEPSIYYWHFRTWFDVWKMNKAKAFALLPKALYTSGLKFVKEAHLAKFSK